MFGKQFAVEIVFSKNPKFWKKIRIGFFLSLEKLFLFYKNTSWEQNKNKKEF